MTKSFWKGFAACYLIGALVMGGSWYRIMPCVNLFGAGYYGLLWPLSPLSVAIGHDLYPIPQSAFSFPCRGEKTA